jgi:tetratricopeptide (TPR) repeat protein
VPDHARIEELRRRVQKDPASLAFAHLAEEYRRAGRFEEAIATCRAGLRTHPTYLSAKVTLGRALLETGDLDAAQAELQAVMTVASDNLAAIRGLAEIHQRRGELQDALDYYQWALEFAGYDSDLVRQIDDLKATVQPAGPAPAAVALSSPTAAMPAAEEEEPSPGAAAPAVSAPIAQWPVPPPTPVASSRPAAQLRPQRQLEACQRLLDAIVADRERRHAPH